MYSEIIVHLINVTTKAVIKNNIYWKQDTIEQVYKNRWRQGYPNDGYFRDMYLCFISDDMRCHLFLTTSQ